MYFDIFTPQVAFAATDAVAGLKMIDAGMPKERLAMLGVPMIPIQIILTLIISKYTGGSEPLNVFIKAYPFRYVYRSPCSLASVYRVSIFGNWSQKWASLKSIG